MKDKLISVKKVLEKPLTIVVKFSTLTISCIKLKNGQTYRKIFKVHLAIFQHYA